jgi:uncharacterized protein (TIRG00374 family)
MIGLYAVFLVASLCLMRGRMYAVTPAMWAISQVIFCATAVGGIAVMLVLIPGFTNGRFSQWLASLPKVGSVLERMISAVRMYREQRLMLAGTLILSMLVHLLMSASIFSLANGLFGAAPTLLDHLIIVPLSCVAGALPLTPAGLGSFELAMEELYRMVPAAGSAAVSGILIAHANRLTTISIAAIGVVFFWVCPRNETANERVDGLLPVYPAGERG